MGERLLQLPLIVDTGANPLPQARSLPVSARFRSRRTRRSRPTPPRLSRRPRRRQLPRPSSRGRQRWVGVTLAARRSFLFSQPADLAHTLPQIIIKREERTKRKVLTHIQGLELFGVDLKKAAKLFASKFATGSSVSKNPQGQDEIVVQGDVGDEVVSCMACQRPS